MPKTFIESIFCGLYADKPDNDEVMYYWNTLFENIVLFSDPKHKNTVEDYFYDIVCGLCRAQELQGFKRGLSHAFKLAAECTATPTRTTSQTKAEHENLYREDVRFAVALSAGEKPPPTRKTNAPPEDSAPPSTAKTGGRNYIDEVFFQLSRADEAVAILDAALALEPFETESAKRNASKLLSSALDIQHDAIPKAHSLLSEYTDTKRVKSELP